MDWKEPEMFVPADHGNKPFAVRIPSLVVSRGGGDRLNFLTAMWFSPMGTEPSRMVVAILKRTLTYQLILERGEFVMSAPTDAMMDIVVFGGYVSGKDADKWKAAGLTAVRPSKGTVPLIGEAIGNVEYRLVQVIPFGDELDLFVGEVLAAHMRKGSMEGELFREGSNPLLYMGTKYGADGKPLGKFFTHMGKIERADYDSPLLKEYLRKPKDKNKN